jgi:ArsR family transcriptional regulator, arsenate/arsenite/antimonite-responsive transcriptional repressor
MDKIFKALADINRRKIVSILKKKDCTVSEMLKNFDIGQATLSSHLAILKKARIVSSKVDNKWRIYSLNKDILMKFVKELVDFAEYSWIKNDEIIMRRK